MQEDEFWSMVNSWDDEKRRQLLHFWTGQVTLPIGELDTCVGWLCRCRMILQTLFSRFSVTLLSLHCYLAGGFAKLQLILQSWEVTQALPASHACNRQLDLPKFSSPDEMQTAFTRAFEHISEGFQLV